MIESIILIGGLVLFSGTATYDMNHKLADAQKGNTITAEKGQFIQDVKHK